jgi:hypothetical protein
MSNEATTLLERIAKYRQWAHRGIFSEPILASESLDLEETLSGAHGALEEAAELLDLWFNTRGEMSGAGTVEDKTRAWLARADEKR